MHPRAVQGDERSAHDIPAVVCGDEASPEGQQPHQPLVDGAPAAGAGWAGENNH
jgi:hypothetical protein